MRRRRNRIDEIDHELPREFEVVFWVIGAVAGLVAAALFMWRVTAPARLVEQMLGIQIPIDSLLDATWPYAILIGVVSAMSARWMAK